MTIIDTSTPTTSQLRALQQAGVTGVIRYYCPTKRNKRLTHAEAEKIIAAGLSIAVVYQDKGNTAMSFSGAVGARDGGTAYDYATRVIGQPAGSAIYFGVDYDAPDSDVRNRIIPHFQGVQSAFQDCGGKYRIGVYGSGAVCAAILDHGLADYAWLSQSSGHRDSKVFLASGRWTLHQLPTRRMADIMVDTNDLNPKAEDYGQFNQLASPSADDVGARDVASGMSDTEIIALQAALRKAGYQPGNQDGVFGNFTRAALLAFQADQGLPITGVADAATIAALDSDPTRPLSRKRVAADASQLRANGSQVVLGADNTKLAGRIAAVLGGLGLGNSAAVEIANTIVGAGQSAAARPAFDPTKLMEAVQKAAALPKGSANNPAVSDLVAAIREIQGLALDKALSPENLQILNLFKSALTSSGLVKINPVVKQFFEHLPAAAHSAQTAAKSIHTIFDLLPGLFADGTLQTVFQGASAMADSILPGFGGSLLTIALGLAVNSFSNRIVDARVDDHRTGTNLRF